MSRKLVWLWLLLLAFGGVVHAATGDFVPTAAKYAVKDVNCVESILPEKMDLVKIGEEDMMRDRMGLPPRFAIPQKVSINLDRQGTWESLGNGQMLWRLRVQGREGTTSLNLGFTRFKMSPSARLLLYSSDGKQVVRPFTTADNSKRTSRTTTSA